MRKSYLLVIAIFILSSCGVTLQTFVQPDLTKTYINPLILIPYEKHQTANFAKNLKGSFEEVFKINNQKLEVLLVETSKEYPSINSSYENENKINYAISNDEKDLIIVFKLTRLEYYKGGLQKASYQLTGIDLETQIEVWEASFSSSGLFGPSTFANSSAQKIFQKLKEDKILK